MEKLDNDIKAAEERFKRDLMRENSELQKKLSELSALILERDAARYADIEVRRGRQVRFT